MNHVFLRIVTLKLPKNKDIILGGFSTNCTRTLTWVGVFTWAFQSTPTIQYSAFFCVCIWDSVGLKAHPL